MRKQLKAIGCFAPSWDSNTTGKKDDFCDECRRLGIQFKCIDVEDNVDFTIKHGIRNVPAIVLFDSKKKVVGIERGNFGYQELYKYVV